MSDSETLLRNLFYRHGASAVFSMFGAMASLMGNNLLAGMFFGSSGLAIMSIASPFYFLFCAIGSLLCVGGSTVAAGALGRDDKKGAAEAFSIAVIYSVLFSFIASCIAIFFMEEIVIAFGAPDGLVEIAESYSLIYCLGGFCITLIYVPFNFLRLMGKLSAMNFLFLGMAVLNALLDYIFVKIIPMGVDGIALGTVLAYGLASFTGIYILVKDKGGFGLVKPPQIRRVLKLVGLGTPPALNNLLTFLRMLFMNRIIVSVAGTGGLAIFSVVSTLENFSLVILSGIAQATSSFVSVFSKERDTVSVRRIEKHAHILAFGLMVPLMAFLLLEPETICRFFGITMPSSLGPATDAVRIFALSLPPSVCAFLMFFYFQGAEYTNLANALIFARSFLFILLPAWLLSLYFGLNGVWLAFVVASLAPMLIMLFVIPYYKRQGLVGVLLQDLSFEEHGAYISFSVEPKTEAIVESTDKIEDFCFKNDIRGKDAMLLKMAMEEMLLSIAKHAYDETSGEKEKMDVRILNLKREDEIISILRIRSGGRIFNPIDYYKRMEEEDPLALEDALGIAMVKNAAQAVFYKSTFGINNLTVVISKEI